MGVTASVGVSFNKIFAKLGSDIKKPDATTVISRENFKDIVWKLPVHELLYVGSATQRKLVHRGISTIGELAQTKPTYFHALFGKWGDVLYAFANGMDNSPVTVLGEESIIKSIGNSSTTPRDLENNQDVTLILYVLCKSVAMRLREHGLECRTVEIYIRDTELASFTRQQKQLRPTNLASEIHRAAMRLFENSYTWLKPIRSLGVKGCEIEPAGGILQLTLLDEEEKRNKLERLELTVDKIRQRYGNLSFSTHRPASGRH